MSEIVEFESNTVRRIWDEETEQYYFAVVDMIELLTDSVKPRDYWYRLKKRVKASSELELSTLCRQFPMKHPKNKRIYKTECADVEGMFRIIQSVPSPKAEPIKQWLAQTGRERLEEIENPELAIDRMRQTYLDKGYDPEWIENRIQSIAVRNELTDEWEARGVEGRQYGILSSEISKGTFGISPGEHKNIKGLKRQNLRDHMSNLELIFTMLGEASSTEITRKEDAQGFYQNKKAAQAGGKIAGDARKALEAETGKPVVSTDNFLPNPKKKAELEAKESEIMNNKEEDDGIPFWENR